MTRPTNAPTTHEQGPKRVGFLELFFDLVFVFAITQLVSVLHDDHSATGWARAGILLWLVWWAWSQYTWTANAVDVDGRTTRLFLLAATLAMLLAASAMPQAFDDDGLAFALPYVAVRLLGLGLYRFGQRGTIDRAALRTYLPVALGGPVLVLVGGLLDGTPRTIVWTVAIATDLASVIAAGRGEFRIDPHHFVERHGLIVIIALGESVIAVGATATDVGLTSTVTLLVAVAFVAVAAMWWCYFDWVHGAIQERLAREDDGRRRGHLARDLCTLGHLPIVAGIVVVAAAIEEALLHPDEPLPWFGATALALGGGLYLAGFVIGNLRATGRVLVPRLVGLVVVVVGALAFGTRIDPLPTVGLVAGVLTTVAAIEGRPRPVTA